jgi:hypothetical protein
LAGRSAVHYSITSSICASSEGEIIRPSACAVFILISPYHNGAGSYAHLRQTADSSPFLARRPKLMVVAELRKRLVVSRWLEQRREASYDSIDRPGGVPSLGAEHGADAHATCTRTHAAHAARRGARGGRRPGPPRAQTHPSGDRPLALRVPGSSFVWKALKYRRAFGTRRLPRDWMLGRELFETACPLHA